MDLKQIQYFICLYEEQSVTRAAQRLNIVQPALSMQMARLEGEVGRELFTRTTKGMRPTPTADEMYSLFLPLVSAFSKAKAQVMHDGHSLSGHVRLGIVASIGHNVLPSALMHFTDQNPKVTLSITEGLTDRLCESVSSGHLDFALVNSPRGFTNLAQELVLREDVLLVSNARGTLKLPPEIAFKEILGHKLILPTRDHGLRAIIDDAAKKAGIPLIPALELDSILSQAILVNQGSYLSFYPRSIVENLKNRASIRVRTHLVQSPALLREIVYVYNPQRAPSQAAQAFAQALTEAVRDTNSINAPRDLFVDGT